MSTPESTVTQTALPTGTWNVDPVHSSVEFHVKHLGIATVKGHFNEFEGTLVVGDDGITASGSVKVASVDTRESQRDEHLRSPDFFDAENHPEITFKSTSVRPLDEDTYEIEGDFTIRGITRPLKLEASVEGTESDPQGNQRVGLAATAQINRSDYDIKFNMALGSGNFAVGEKVKILLDISAVKAG
ncbi:MAG: YceI family protein [Solirubrobacteraceae bacterium]